MKISAVAASLCVMGVLLSGCSQADTKASVTDYERAPVSYEALGSQGELEPDLTATENKQLAAENVYLQLWYDRDTAVVSVFDRRSGAWWHTNPDEEGDNQTADLKSQITFDTVNTDGVIKHYTSFTDSLNKRQVEFVTGENGLTVVYTFGNLGPDLSGIPTKLTNERYQAICEMMDDTGKRRMRYRYELDEETNIWTLKENPTRDMAEKLKEALDSIGYSEEDLEADREAAGVTEPPEENKNFVIPLEYVLEKDSLLVRVAAEGLQVPKEEYISSLNVLEYFGALSAGQDGYLLIPDGSGALVDTTPVTSAVGTYRARIYGWDETVSEESRGSNKRCDILLPVFGINRIESGVLAVVEDNQAAGYIKATGVGAVDNYATVSANFQLMTSENIGLTASGNERAKYWVSNASLYQGNSDVRYVFLEAGKCDYSGMAQAYRTYLQRHGGLRAMTEVSGDLPLFVETVAAVGTQVSTAGFLHDAYAPLTTYEDNIDLLKRMSELGVSDIRLILSGWMSGGTEQMLADRAALLKVLGGEEGFKALTDYMAAGSGEVRLYPEVLFNTMSMHDSLWKRDQYSVLTVGQRKSKLKKYDTVTGQPDDEDYRLLVSPTYKLSLAQSFLSSFSRLEAGGICVGDLAGTVYSDFNENNEFLRQYALFQSNEILKLLKSGGSDLLLRAPNDVNACLSDVFSDIPDSSSSYMLFSASVPFYQMVFHGAADYSLGDLNWSADYRESLLKCVEYGACPKFKFTYREDDRLSFSEYDWLYASSFERQAERAAESYAYVNKLLKPVRSAVMLRHEMVAEGVYATHYDNGYTIYVNYNAEPVQVGNVTIPETDAVLCETGGAF